MNVVISMVPIEHVADVWPNIKELIASAVEEAHGRASVEQTYNDLLEASQILWIAFNNDDPEKHIVGCCTIRIIEYPSGKYISALMGAGDKGEGREWIFNMLDVLRGFGEEFGCIGTEISGRRGWLRYLSHDGYNEVFTVIEQVYHGQGRRGRRLHQNN
jgi:hypothetical protein